MVRQILNLALAKRRGERRTLRWGITRAERDEYAELLKTLDLRLQKCEEVNGGQLANDRMLLS